MPKITKSDREYIVKTVTEKVIGAKREALTKRENELADKVRAHILGEHIHLANNLPDMLANVGNCFWVRVRKADGSHSCGRNLRLATPQRMWVSIRGDNNVFFEGTELGDAIAALDRAWDELWSEESELNHKLWALIKPIQSTTALLKAWPEAKEYFPDHFFESSHTDNLPALPSSEVNELIAKLKLAA